MNSNTFTLFLFILIIICAVYYLVMINNRENSCIEKFSQTNSLSTMYQQTIDDNEFQDKYRKNTYNQFHKDENESFTESLLESMWNGNWNDSENPPSVFSSFLPIALLTCLEKVGICLLVLRSIFDYFYVLG